MYRIKACTWNGWIGFLGFLLNNSYCTCLYATWSEFYSCKLKDSVELCERIRILFCVVFMEIIVFISCVLYQVDWGEATMIEAERILLKHALEDPLNQRFAFVSDRWRLAWWYFSLRLQCNKLKCASFVFQFMYLDDFHYLTIFQLLDLFSAASLFTTSTIYMTMSCQQEPVL